MESVGHILLHAVEHSLIDTLYLIPFLFATYLAMEWLEHRAGSKTEEMVRRAGVAGPVVGAVLGVVPQCGFSAAAATLYAGRVITLGTLFAVFLSTSDEMLPIFIASQVPAMTIVKIIGTKLVIGILVGFIVDAFMHILRRDEDPLKIHELCAQDGCECSGDCQACEARPESVYESADCSDCCEGKCDHEQSADHQHEQGSEHQHVTCCDHDHAHDHDHEHDHTHAHDHQHHHHHGSIWKSAARHTIQVTVFIFLFTLVLNGVLEVIGEEVLAEWLASNQAASVVASAIIGLVPNCAASIAIAELYVEGVLNAGAMMSGLLVAAGVGVLVLCRSNRRPAQNILIIAILLVVGILSGFIINAFGVVF